MAGESSKAPTPMAPVASSSRDSDKLKKGLGTVFQTVKRALTIKKRTKPSQSSSTDALLAAQQAQQAQQAQPVQPPSQAPIAVDKTEPAAPPVPQKIETLSSPLLKAPTSLPVTKARGPLGPPHTKTSAQRVIELFKKHGIEVPPTALHRSDVPPGERVHKEIRMRVHRTCHKCNTGYGAERICLGCGHRRCKQCPRFPMKGEKAKGKGKEKVGEKREVKPIVRRRKGETGLTISRAGPRQPLQPLLHKKIRQRVHRTCHKCHTDFGPEKICSKCNHNRCKKCPHNPHKKNKPAGYYERDQSDSESEKPISRRPLRTYKKIRQRVHWKCSKCSAEFQYGNKICDCGARREVTGIRDPPKKPKNQYRSMPSIRSESYMENLEERLMATSIA